MYTRAKCQIFAHISAAQQSKTTQRSWKSAPAQQRGHQALAEERPSHQPHRAGRPRLACRQSWGATAGELRAGEPIPGWERMSGQPTPPARAGSPAGGPHTCPSADPAPQRPHGLRPQVRHDGHGGCVAAGAGSKVKQERDQDAGRMHGSAQPCAAACQRCRCHQPRLTHWTGRPAKKAATGAAVGAHATASACPRAPARMAGKGGRHCCTCSRARRAAPRLRERILPAHPPPLNHLLVSQAGQLFL